jgi:hypothetical protein
VPLDTNKLAVGLTAKFESASDDSSLKVSFELSERGTTYKPSNVLGSRIVPGGFGIGRCSWSIGIRDPRYKRDGGPIAAYKINLTNLSPQTVLYAVESYKV